MVVAVLMMNILNPLLLLVPRRIVLQDAVCDVGVKYLAVAVPPVKMVEQCIGAAVRCAGHHSLSLSAVAQSPLPLCNEVSLFCGFGPFETYWAVNR